MTLCRLADAVVDIAGSIEDLTRVQPDSKFPLSG